MTTTAVLYVDHTALVSGGQQSLIELLRGLPDGVDAEVACPPGELSERVRALGLPVCPIGGTEGSFNLHPLRTPLALLEMARAGLRVRAYARRRRVDVVHANSVRAGIITLAGFGPRRLRSKRPAVVVHVRDSLPPSLTGRLVRGAVNTVADCVIAISQHTRDNFTLGRSKPRVVVVYNGLDTQRFRPRKRKSAAPSTIGMIGQITPWKAQDDAIRCVAAVRASGLDARLKIAGSAKFVGRGRRYDNASYERDLHELARELAVAHAVDFLGEVEDVGGLLEELDLVLVPSWEEPFGRVIIEAMATGVPPVATDRGGPPEIITDGVDGLLLPPRQPDRWAEAVVALLRRPDELRKMGEAARLTAQRFARDRHVVAVIRAYDAARRSASFTLPP